MRRRIVFLFASVLFLVAASAASDNPAVGKWDTTTNDGSDRNLRWTLVVTEDAGKLSGKLISDTEEIPLVEPRVEGDLFLFKLVINANCTVETKLKIQGNKFEGKFSCPEVSGTMKGTRQS